MSNWLADVILFKPTAKLSLCFAVRLNSSRFWSAAPLNDNLS